jgi:hypothetical protein
VVEIVLGFRMLFLLLLVLKRVFIGKVDFVYMDMVLGYGIWVLYTAFLSFLLRDIRLYRKHVTFYFLRLTQVWRTL